MKEKSKAVSENGNEEIREIQEIKAIEDTVCTPPDTQPEIRGIAGAYAGGIIPVHRGEMLLLGSDLKNCNLILEGEGISECHCSVEFDRESNRYMVMDFSEKGTYTDGNVRLRKGEYEALKRKSILILGSEENIFMLE